MEHIYQEYGEYIFRFLVGLCREEELARDLTQETFCKAIQSLDRFDGTCKITTWLCQIAKHLWYQEVERRKRRGDVELIEDITAFGESPEEKIQVKEEKMALFHRVHLLDPVTKEVVLLRVTGAFSFREIGELFQKNENWARVTFYRARQKLGALQAKGD